MTEDKFQKEEANWKQLAEERLNAWKRSAADFENYKKRKAKEDESLMVFVKEMVVLKLLPTLEALDAALKSPPDGDGHKDWLAGVNRISDTLAKSMKELGVEKIKTLGEKFNHELHEAVEMIDEPQKSGEIIAEIASGYKINGRVVRPAKVKVAK